ncbi:MAG: ATP-binding cassette domain-containing protein, partial [bacterium]
KDACVLFDINLKLDRGKTYALVGPTGGGKTTTASLIARLYDPTNGQILLNGQDMVSLTENDRSEKIGFILQDPFLFSGTIKDNLIYGNGKLQNVSSDELVKIITDAGLETLLKKLDGNLEKVISANGDDISLGQKQLIAFMRAVLRKPDVLILDEATANIDTVTEQLLDKILKKLPSTTTKIIIAHRLNTIEHADSIFFISNGKIIEAGSIKNALKLIMNVGHKK